MDTSNFGAGRYSPLIFVKTEAQFGVHWIPQADDFILNCLQIII